VSSEISDLVRNPGRISEENKLNTTTQQFITAKISGCVLKQGNRTNSSLRQRNLQLQQSSIKKVRLDWLAHIQGCQIGFLTPNFINLACLEALGVKHLFGFFF